MMAMMTRTPSAGVRILVLACLAGPLFSQATTRGRAVPGPLPGPSTIRVSVDSAEVQANAVSGESASLSADGRYVAFPSFASNLVPGDTNGFGDVFVRDLQRGTTERVSVDSAGAQANGQSASGANNNPVISGDGRFVAFTSYASNLVPGDTNGWPDVFVHDCQSGSTERVNVDSFEAQANGGSINSPPSISFHGRYVAFWSGANNLVPGDTNGWPDIFVRDRQSGTTERVSVASAGAQGNLSCLQPSISGDGRYVAFWSYASNLVPGDTNSVTDIFVRDRLSGTTERVSVDSAGVQSNAASSACSISDNGRFVAFNSAADNLVPGDTNADFDVFVHDRLSGATERVSVDSATAQGNLGSYCFLTSGSISANGRYVAFFSDSTNLVPGDTNGRPDVFVHDRHSGITTRVSVDSAGAQRISVSYYASISSDGRYVAFQSSADLVPGDTNNLGDIFVHTYRAP